MLPACEAKRKLEAYATLEIGSEYAVAFRRDATT